MRRFVLAVLCTVGFLSVSAPVSRAQSICWDTVCAAGTPAADCWRAWCVEGWSYPAYPYRPAGWYRAEAPSPYSAPGQRYWGIEPLPTQRFQPLTPAQGCSTGRWVDQILWGC